MPRPQRKQLVKVPEDLVPGASFRVYYGDNNSCNERIHIRGIVDHQIVYRWWARRRNSWRYCIEPIDYFELRKNNLFPVQLKTGGV